MMNKKYITICMMFIITCGIIIGVYVTSDARNKTADLPVNELSEYNNIDNIFTGSSKDDSEQYSTYYKHLSDLISSDIKSVHGVVECNIDINNLSKQISTVSVNIVKEADAVISEAEIKKHIATALDVQLEQVIITLK